MLSKILELMQQEDPVCSTDIAKALNRPHGNVMTMIRTMCKSMNVEPQKGTFNSQKRRLIPRYVLSPELAKTFIIKQTGSKDCFKILDHFATYRVWLESKSIKGDVIVKLKAKLIKAIEDM